MSDTNDNVHVEQQVDEPSTEDSQTTIQKLKDNIRTVIDKLNEICKVNTVMLEKIQILTRDNDQLYEITREQKIELTELNQYGRRENVEFCNIPESIGDKDLEEHILTICQSLGMKKISAYNIVAVHRIGKRLPSKPRNVIVRFVNRKHAFSLLKNKKKLKDGEYKRYFIIENLCPFNKRIFNALYKRKMNKEMHSLWTFNGQVFMKWEETSDRIHVSHFDDIQDIFEEDESGGSPYGDDGGQSSLNSTTNTSGDLGDFSGNIMDSSSFHASTQQNSSRRVTSRRRLSLIEEETDSILRTPIPPLVIKI